MYQIFGTREAAGAARRSGQTSAPLGACSTSARRTAASSPTHAAHAIATAPKAGGSTTGRHDLLPRHPMIVHSGTAMNFTMFLAFGRCLIQILDEFLAGKIKERTGVSQMRKGVLIFETVTGPGLPPGRWPPEFKEALLGRLPLRAPQKRWRQSAGDRARGDGR